jgi:serine-type D-Ala-D-Ala carboxypeptidase
VGGDRELQRFLDELIAAGDASAAVALVGSPGAIERAAAAGLARRPSSPAAPATRFDYASLTKPFVATLALRLDAGGRLPLDMPVGEIFPRAAPALAERPLSDLLAHRSGLAAWTPFYARCASREEALALLLGGSLLGALPDTYSDLGYLLYAFAAEARLGAPLDRLLRDEVFSPLALSSIAPSPGDRPDIAESLLDTSKESALAAAQGLAVPPLPPPPPGLPQDGNARFFASLGSAVPGHAGLFGNAADLFALGGEWLAPGRLLQPTMVARALAYGGPGHALGWQRRAHDSVAAARLSPRAFGQMGYAGGSLFVDLDRQLVAVLLAHRSRPEADMNAWRRRFHALL